jgi:predicted RNA-binding protein YlqC (UPF0109 family)
MSSIDQQFVEFVVKSLVSKPDEVQVERRIDEKGVLLELTVDPEDLGRVIGKRGATAQSLRTLLRALGTKNDARYNLKIVDNGLPGAGRSHDDDRANNSAPTYDQVAPALAPSDDQSAPVTSDVNDEVEEEVVVTQPEISSSDRINQELEDLDDLDV